jgi:hypothetical protein
LTEGDRIDLGDEDHEEVVASSQRCHVEAHGEVEVFRER